jgi:hypothetical protein
VNEANLTDRGLRVRFCGRSSHRALIVAEEFRVLNRSVMVHLTPAAIDQLKNASRSNVEVFRGITIAVGAALPTYSPKNVTSAMNRIVPKFDMDVRWALENGVIHLVRLIRAASNASERVVNRDFIGMREIFVDHLEIARIESAVELSQGLLRLA